ncbi:MAG TPA: NCS2 family permease, partial [Coxiellaceae bacterium]|nr:NCS2 family permease [Coxiellaceae bacterium]
MKKTIHFLEHFFKVQAAGSSAKTEFIAGVTSFLTMAYILLVNPSILGSVGMNPGAAFVATCLASALGCLLMGVMANYPIAIAPSMALNAYFAYVIVQGMGYSWQVALGAVLLAGVLFLALTILGARQWIIRAIPESLHVGVCAGIGLFIGLLAFKSAGVVVANPQTLVSLGAITSAPVVLFLVGFCLIVGLDYLRVPGAIIIGILVTTLLGLLTGHTQFHGFMALPPSLDSTWMHFSFDGLWTGHGPAIIFSFFLVALFDAAGTLVGVLQAPQFKNDPHRP